jgi:hypothetical protein
MKPKYLPLFFFIIIICLCCKNTKPPVVTVSNTSCPVPQKIIVYKENVYDLSGYENGGGSSPYNLFDENAFVDPKMENKDSSYYIPVTNPQPTIGAAIYFAANKGSRIVADLQVAYKLSEVYLYDNSNNSDSVWVYTGTMINWKLKAAFVSGDTRGWRRFPLDENAQYIMIRFSSPQTKITEMVLYGCPDGAIPPPPVHNNTDPPFTKIMMKEFLGANDFNGIKAKWTKPFYYNRLYAFTGDYDHDAEHEYPNVQYTMLRFGYWNNGINDYYFMPEDAEKLYGHKVWYAMNGLPFWMSKGDNGMKGRPVTKLGMDPEDPMSYARNANMMWTIAAFFGHTKVDTNLISLSHSPKKSGRGTLSVYENGNEYDATWIGDKYCNPVEYFAQSSADYDGNENALGAKCGVKNADSTSTLITAGLIDLDTNRIKVYKFLCNTLRKDKYFLWKGGVQYHHYCNRDKHGITPEEDSLRWRLAKVKAATDRIQPGVPCILGENGYDKFQGSTQAAPLLPGLSNAECQGIFILRCINATAFSGFDSYILYWLRDTDPEDNKGIYLTSGLVRQMPDGSIKPYASWFYVSAFENRLANYAPDKIISEKGNVWIYKYRNQLAPDSIAYFVYSPTHNGSKVDNYALNIGTTNTDDAQEINFTSDNADGVVVNKKISKGIVSVNVEERPKIILMKEK